MPRYSLRTDLSAARTSIRSLQRLIDGLATKARQLELAAATNGSPARGERRKLTLTPQRRAQLKLQAGRDPSLLERRRSTHACTSWGGPWRDSCRRIGLARKLAKG